MRVLVCECACVRCVCASVWCVRVSCAKMERVSGVPVCECES